MTVKNLAIVMLIAGPAFSSTLQVSTTNNPPRPTDRAKAAAYHNAHPRIASQVGTGQGIITQVAAGGGWTTAITINNLSSIKPAAYVLDFYGDDGANKTFSFDTGGTGNQLRGTLNPNGSAVVEALSPEGCHVNVNCNQGWAQFEYLNTDSWVSGCAVFTAANGNSAAVPFGDDLAQDLFLTFNTTGGYGLGVAMASTDFVTLSIVATVYDESGGTVKTINGITIPVGCHMAFDLVQTWGLADMKGTIVFRTSDAYTSPAIGLAVLGIRYNPQGFFTSIPAIEASTLDGSSQ